MQKRGVRTSRGKAAQTRRRAFSKRPLRGPRSADLTLSWLLSIMGITLKHTATPTLDPPRILKRRRRASRWGWNMSHTHTRSAEDTETWRSYRPPAGCGGHTHTRSAEDTETFFDDAGTLYAFGATPTLDPPRILKPFSASMWCCSITVATPTLDPPRILKPCRQVGIERVPAGHTHTRSAEDTETMTFAGSSCPQL